MGSERIALFLPSLQWGGAQRVALNLTREFARREIAVDLVLANAEGPYLAEVPAGVGVVDLGASRVLASVPGLARYLRRARPCALLSGLVNANVAALWARGMARSPARVVVSVHEPPSANVGHVRTARARLLPHVARRLYPWADGIIAVSEGVANDLSLVTEITRDRVTVIYNPVVTPELAEQAKVPVHHPWFSTEGPPVILGAGRLTQPKDFRTLIRAFALLERPEPRLVILGEGPDRPSLEGLIRDFGLGGRVELLGFVVNPFAYMARARVFVLSSTSEGLGNVLVEAMACGCPVIATDCSGGPREVLRGGDFGELVPVSDAEAMAAALRSVLTRPPRPARLQSRAADFSVATIADRYLEVLLGKS